MFAVCFPNAERKGFEPLERSSRPFVFKTNAIDHSATSPLFQSQICQRPFKILCKYTNNFWYFQIFFQLFFLNSWYICFYLKQRCKYTYFFWKNQILIWYFLHFIVFIAYLSLVKRYFSRGSDWEQGISLPPTGPWFSRDVRWDIPHFFCSDYWIWTNDHCRMKAVLYHWAKSL